MNICLCVTGLKESWLDAIVTDRKPGTSCTDSCNILNVVICQDALHKSTFTNVMYAYLTLQDNSQEKNSGQLELSHDMKCNKCRSNAACYTQVYKAYHLQQIHERISLECSAGIWQFGFGALVEHVVLRAVPYQSVI